jgi:hypothetical protein
MVAGAVAERVGLQVRQAAEDGDLVLHAGKGLEDGRQVEAGANGGGHPLILDDAVGDVHEAEAWRGLQALGGHSRHHRVQERQRHGGPHGLQERPPRQRLLRDEHQLASLITNGRLRTTPMTSADIV